jgi:beta-fructofuranosidase
LLTWDKHSANPLLESDPRWYEKLDQGRWRDESWRDPWLFTLPDDRRAHALITARSAQGPPEGAGVLAYARSADFVTWEVFPPITSAGDFAQVEVPQLVHHDDGRCTILFSCLGEDHSPGRVSRLGRAGQSGTYALLGEGVMGPYVASDQPVAAARGDLGVLYAGKVLQDEGELRFMGFRGDGNKDFLGELTDPLPVGRDGAGFLVVT